MKVFNVYDETQVRQTVDFIRKLEFKDGKATARGSAKDIKQNYQITQEVKEARPIFNDVRKLFLADGLLSSYTTAKEVVSPRVASYKDGGHYGWHVDMAIMNQKRTDMSFTLMLSDGYEGGELEIDLGHMKQSAKLKKGQMVVYPTGVLHQVNPVTSGERLCIVGWLSCGVRDQEDREALFKMGYEIQRLKQFVDDPAELNQLNYLAQHFRRKLTP
ncbi:Fe2+-dependent dioxygenase [Candidatus Halocynthiibacter alkanivorans]|uniref:Fe2+-dependent dioxygenase n=1 Tax=Candidatus Halocynthiibacter alkanivorans TaxID=2267619 RepID=UPI000DF48F01|nr:Fe2+-dependent dioxygenase [Candidatus Halocynthiibacter alkanivorans]